MLYKVQYYNDARGWITYDTYASVGAAINECNSLNLLLDTPIRVMSFGFTNGIMDYPSVVHYVSNNLSKDTVHNWLEEGF